MKKKIIKIVILILVLLYLINRIYCFMVVSKVHKAVEKFKNEENRSYVATTKSNGRQLKRRILFKNDIVKCITKSNEIDLYCEWIDLKTEQEYRVNLQSKNFKKGRILVIDRNSLANLHRLIISIYQDNQFHLKEFLKTTYVQPIEYNNQKCYKIVTQTETLIVDQENCLPIYYSFKVIGAEADEDNVTENTYEFKVGEVTDEEISLPDLT